jgi:hypothetical protein
MSDPQYLWLIASLLIMRAMPAGICLIAGIVVAAFALYA